jgi:hypothetical protein
MNNLRQRNKDLEEETDKKVEINYSDTSRITNFKNKMDLEREKNKKIRWKESQEMLKLNNEKIYDNNYK